MASVNSILEYQGVMHLRSFDLLSVLVVFMRMLIRGLLKYVVKNGSLHLLSFKFHFEIIVDSRKLQR